MPSLIMSVIDTAKLDISSDWKQTSFQEKNHVILPSLYCCSATPGGEIVRFVLIALIKHDAINCNLRIFCCF